MQESSKPIVLVALSVFLAALADLLLHDASWGVNVGLWALAVAGVSARLFRRMPREQKGLAEAALLFALLFSLRDSDALKLANLFAMAFCLGAMALPLGPRRLVDAPFGRLLGAPFRGFGSIVRQAFTLFQKARDDRADSPDRRRRNGAVFRGLLFATPLLLIFGGLFASADAVFRTGIENLGRIDLDFEAFSTHVGLILLSLTFVAGLFGRLVFAPAAAPEPFGPPPKPNQIGIIEVGIVLGSLVALFGAFLMVQFRYLFGAEDVVRATAGLSYAEYARGGFFELLGVAALTLVVLVGADSLLRRERTGDDRLYRVLGRTLGGMVFLIVGSAFLRMKLYADAFGLTELRVYSTVFMVWLTLAFVWLFATTLAGRPHRFAFGILVAGLAVILGTNLLNPDALIVRTNLSKPKADFAYLKALSDDAVLASIGAPIPAAHREEWSAHVAKRKAHAARSDWRELNLSRLMLRRR